MNQLKTFNTLEQAIMELKGFINRGSYNPDAPKTPNAIYPARYDHAPINNMARQISEKIALTDRQQKLAVLLVTKYHKQWKKQGFDVSNISLDTPTERPIRTDIDRSKWVSAADRSGELESRCIPAPDPNGRTAEPQCGFPGCTSEDSECRVEDEEQADVQ